MNFQIAVDVGGTFTDLVVQDATGRIRTFKSSTTPGQIAEGILNGLSLVADYFGLKRTDLLTSCVKLSVGTTVATNAILQGLYARTALICTEGFRDTLLVREGGKEDSYNIFSDYPSPYIPRSLTYGVRERVNSEGGVEIALIEEHALEIISQIKAQKVEAIAVSLLWSIVNPTHEQRIGQLIELHCPGVAYSLSHQTSPTLREYRRTSATAIDASLKPLVRTAVADLESKLRAAGLDGVLTLVTSSGGQTAPSEIISRPIHLCLSGPSAAPEAARQLLRSENSVSGKAIIVDMGGTSFDISLINDWKIPMHREGVIAGHTFGVPSVEVKTIGAGGGSIARVDVGGFIHVGPESAGALPGPACYGRGGTKPTVTDANLVCGFLNAENFAGGTLKLLKDRAENAIHDHVAKPLGISTQEAATLIRVSVEQNMVAAIEEITIRRGVDPREYTMVAGGAAAGLHAVAMARELRMKNVLVPPVAGVLSAFGILVSDVQSGFARSFTTNSRIFDSAGVDNTLAELEIAARAYLDRMNVPEEQRELQYSTEARYQGQVWQLSLSIDRNIRNGIEDVIENFHRLHEQFYYVRSSDPIEFTEWSVLAIGRVPRIPPNHGIFSDRPGSRAQNRTRSVYAREFGGAHDLPLFESEHFSSGMEIQGPAIIDLPLTSLVIHSDNRARISENGSVWVTIG